MHRHPHCAVPELLRRRCSARNTAGIPQFRCRTLLYAVLVTVALLPPSAEALNFTPTDFEWSTWPVYCRARYVISAAGRDSKFRAMVSQSTVDEWAQRLDGVWERMHHYCAAVILFEQARKIGDQRVRNHRYQRVVDECDFSLRADLKHPMFSKLITLRARALFELRQERAAFQEFARAIELHPEVSDPYAASGLLLRRMGKRAEARHILEQGIEVISRNAELHYLLGIVLTEMKDYEGALENAKLAYELGYPLPGLRRKLEAAGQWK